MKDPAWVSKFLQWLYEHPEHPLAVDTETAGVTPELSAFGLRVDDGRAHAIGASFSTRMPNGQLVSAYIAFHHVVGENDPDELRKKLRYVLRQGRPLIYANAQFDMLSFETVGIQVDDMPFYDVQTMANMVREDWPMAKDLDSLYRVYVNGEHEKIKEWEYAIYDPGRKTPRKRTTLKWQKENGWPHTTKEMIWEYACRDTEATFEVWEALMAHPAWQEQPQSAWEHKREFIAECLLPARRRGVQVNVELAAELEAEGVVAKAKLLEEMDGLSPSSVVDAPKIFLDILGLPVLRMTEGGKGEVKNPKPSFTAAVLEEYDMILANRSGDNAEQRKWIENVKAWRGWTTAMGLLLRPYQELVSPDGRLRTSYTTHVTSTGRLSSREPNLQQISKEADGKPWKDRIKKCFVARPGYVLLSADYSQLELRLGVAYAQEPELQKIFLEGRDIFSEMAAELGWERPKTKSFVYATQYGGGPPRIAYIFGLTLPNGEPDIKRAKALIERFYRKYPRFRKLNEACKARVEDTKKIRMWSGRVRHFASGKDGYKAMNALLQGGAADIVERVWLHIMKTLDDEENCRVLLQVHDALVFEVKEELADEYRVKIREIMSDVNAICSPGEELFPVKFDVEVSDWE